MHLPTTNYLWRPGEENELNEKMRFDPCENPKDGLTE
jgi:hypothetical protein